MNSFHPILTPTRGRKPTRENRSGLMSRAALVLLGMTTTTLAQDSGLLRREAILPPPPAIVPEPLPPAQTPGTLGGFAPRLPTPARAQPSGVAAGLIESASSPAINLEVRVGQGRFLTFNQPLITPGRPAPLLAVGDPSITDFFQVNPRQLRLIGKRLGTTDLSITAWSDAAQSEQTTVFEVQVVADLDLDL